MLRLNILWGILFVFAQTLQSQTPVYDTGGPLLPEQAAYDVTFYDLALNILPDQHAINGQLTVTAHIVQPINALLLNLDTLLKVSAVEYRTDQGAWIAAPFSHRNGYLNIELPYTRQPGQNVAARVSYGGKPRPAPMAPWNGGFSWSRTQSGAYWIATTCQSEGADVWWPCKDHVSDKPDSMALHITVPKPLVVATNGRLQGIDANADNTSTYHWFVSTPISAYNIALNIAPYRLIEGSLKSVAGDEYPVVFYVLPEDYEKGQALFPQILDHLRFYEKWLGPYPFRADKYGVAQTPHLGMEHQTIIAYGARFDNSSMTRRDWGFDALHHHELAHEWWGNLVTNSDWRDMWIHEGFGSYMQAMYMEQLRGKEGYFEYIKSMRRFPNNRAIAPREATTGDEIYKAPIYTKGAWVLHMLRFLMGDEAFFQSLRRMAYPDPAMEAVTDGRQTRFVNTDDFLHICEQQSGLQLDDFFEVYLRQAALPKLYSRVEEDHISLRWEAPDGRPFTLPVELEIKGKKQRVTVTSQGISVPLPKNAKPVVDPDGWLAFDIVGMEK